MKGTFNAHIYLDWYELSEYDFNKSLLLWYLSMVTKF